MNQNNILSLFSTAGALVVVTVKVFGPTLETLEFSTDLDVNAKYVSLYKSSGKRG